MILETLICSINNNQEVNIAPFGIRRNKDVIVISPYLPSKTHENLHETKYASINYTDDASLFVNCFLKRKKFNLEKCKSIHGFFLDEALSHAEIEVIDYKKDKNRPSFYCKTIYFKNHAPFLGLNRARYALIEACILASRTKILKKNKILNELNYLSNAIEKTSGDQESYLWKELQNYIIKETNKYAK